MATCKPATALGTPSLKTPRADHEQGLSRDQHSAFRRPVGKLHWLTYTRLDVCYTTDLAGELQQFSSADQQKLKHLFRYVNGTTPYKEIRSTEKMTDTTLDLNVQVDSDAAGCAEIRKSTTGFAISFLGSRRCYGSRTLAMIALSSAEAELFAINAGSTEALHVQNLLKQTY